jgi:hypothetical protein
VNTRDFDDENICGLGCDNDLDLNGNGRWKEIERERENTCSDKTIFYFNLCVSMALFSFLPSASMSKEKKI